MTLRRFYVSRNAIQDGTAHLSSDQSHHLRDVLRIGAGEIVEVFDGEGTGYTGEVAFLNSTVSIHNLEQLPSRQPHVPLILAAALIKTAKFEWVLQKATELGVHEIVPVKTRRSEIQIPQHKIVQRCERWDRIVREASRQCGRYSAPRVRQPLDYPEMLRCEDFSGSTKVLFYENAAELWRPDARMLSGSLVLFVGPEGGWDNGEIEQAGRAGCRVCSLGGWILRAETAAIAAVSIVQYHINLQRSGDSAA